jgi:hypothetical protein
LNTSSAAKGFASGPHHEGLFLALFLARLAFFGGRFGLGGLAFLLLFAAKDGFIAFSEFFGFGQPDADNAHGTHLAMKEGSVIFGNTTVNLSQTAPVVTAFLVFAADVAICFDAETWAGKIVSARFFFRAQVLHAVRALACRRLDDIRLRWLHAHGPGNREGA